MRKVIHMVTVSNSINLMSGQIEYLKKNGYNIGLISSPGKELNNSEANFKKAINIEREISILKDFKALLKLTKYFLKTKPEILNTGTPKAGLLGIIASFIARVPNRIYTMRGLRLETTTGMKRKILWITEKISCTLATEVICISPSLLQEARNLKLLKNKGIVLNNGSSNGLDIEEFPLLENLEIKDFIKNKKKEMNIIRKDFIIGFVGRLSKDKGINELVEVFVELNSNYQNMKLILIGSLEELNKKTYKIINAHPNIHYLGRLSNVKKYYYLFDIFVFPTHREGFGNVSIEAQAASVPVITTNATGARDTIIDNKTGLIYPVNNKRELKLSILDLYKDEIKRIAYGKNGRSFVKDNFQSEFIWNELLKLYDQFK